MSVKPASANRSASSSVETVIGPPSGRSRRAASTHFTVLRCGRSTASPAPAIAARIRAALRSNLAGSPRSGGGASVSSTSASAFDRVDIGLHLLVEQVERQRPVLEHGGVEGADVEPIAELAPRFFAKLEDPQLANLVARRLPGIVDVALDLLDDVALGQQRIGLEIGDRLLAAPALGREAGVGAQPDRPPQLQRQVAELRIGVLVEAHLPPEPLGIEPPALDIGAVAAEAPELGHALQLLLERDLEMVARRA